MSVSASPRNDRQTGQRLGAATSGALTLYDELQSSRRRAVARRAKNRKLLEQVRVLQARHSSSSRPLAR